MCFGVPAVDRQEFADKTAGGMAVGTLPLFFKTDTALSADELALDLAGRWEDLLRHRRLPFSEIAALANCSENPGERLFHIALSCQEGKIFRDGGTAVTFSGKWLYSGYQIEHLLILLSRSAGENQYTADYQYLPCLYASEDIEDLHRHITKILSEILSHPRIPVRQLDLLSDGEFERVVYTFNKTAGGIPLPSVAEESLRPSVAEESLRPSVAENFLRAAEKTPDKTALICDDHQITFTGLYERVLLIAARIREQITGQIAPSGNISATETGGEHTVALCLPRGADLVAAMLAACFAGGGWMILPPALPELRLRQMMVDSGAALLVTVPENLPLFDGYTGPVLLIGTVFEAVETGGLPVRSDGGDLAYVAYTSGRTGTPKGVMIEQRSLTNFARSMDAVYAGGGSVLALNSTGFDVFILESVAALLCGRTVVMAKEEQCGDPAALAGLIKKYAVSFFAMTPSRLEAYITNPGFADALGNMESIVCGGEPFCDGLLRRLERLTKARIYNQYGPAETAIGVSYKCLDEGCPLSAGKPMANCRLYVLDEDGNPLPAEAAGELYIGGACVGRGYLKDGEATRKSFLSDMFVAGQRMYRTGDSAKWDKNGEIHLLGRCGEQPEPPGCRAEAHETAALLRTYPRIRQAAVRIIKKGNGGYIAAYYTGPEEIPADRLFAYCGARLPAYMVPHHFEHLQEMPLTISGKTDTGRLPDPLPPAAGEIAVDTTPAAAGKTTLDLLLGIFSRNLEREDLTPDSRYFQSGGNSLGALTVLAEIGSQTGVELSYTELCRLDTPAKIAEAIEKIQRGEPEPPQRENDLPPAPRNPPDMPKAAPQVDLPIDIIADCNAFAAPDADAILWRGRRISFDEFRRRSDSAAARLTETGVRHGDVVGVYCDRTPDLIYAVFGVLKCGAAYLPLTYQLPVERISRVLSLAGAKTVIGDREISGLDPGVFSQCRIPDELMPFRTDVGRSTADIAQFLFVPGEPAKSVSISHRTLGGLLPGLISLWNAAGIAGSVLCTADFLSDAFTAEGLLPLAAKLPVALADGDENMRADGLLEFLGRQDP